MKNIVTRWAEAKRAYLNASGIVKHLVSEAVQAIATECGQSIDQVQIGDINVRRSYIGWSLHTASILSEYSTPDTHWNEKLSLIEETTARLMAITPAQARHAAEACLLPSE